jgi:hypothetical protein
VSSRGRDGKCRAQQHLYLISNNFRIQFRELTSHRQIRRRRHGLASPILRHDSHLKLVLLPSVASSVEEDVVLELVLLNTWKCKSSHATGRLGNKCLCFANMYEALRPGVDLGQQDGDGELDGIFANI